MMPRTHFRPHSLFWCQGSIVVGGELGLDPGCIEWPIVWRLVSEHRPRHARKHERQTAATWVENPVDLARQELSAVIHDEVNRLPENLRLVVVLCLMEGLTTEQAALAFEMPGWNRPQPTRARSPAAQKSPGPRGQA